MLQEYYNDLAKYAGGEWEGIAYEDGEVEEGRSSSSSSTLHSNQNVSSSNGPRGSPSSRHPVGGLRPQAHPLKGRSRASIRSKGTQIPRECGVSPSILTPLPPGDGGLCQRRGGFIGCVRALSGSNLPRKFLASTEHFLLRWRQASRRRRQYRTEKGELEHARIHSIYSHERNVSCAALCYVHSPSRTPSRGGGNG